MHVSRVLGFTVHNFLIFKTATVCRLQRWCVLLGQSLGMLAWHGFQLRKLLQRLQCSGFAGRSCCSWRLWHCLIEAWVNARKSLVFTLRNYQDLINALHYRVRQLHCLQNQGSRYGFALIKFNKGSFVSWFLQGFQKPRTSRARWCRPGRGSAASQPPRGWFCHRTESWRNWTAEVPDFALEFLPASGTRCGEGAETEWLNGANGRIGRCGAVYNDRTWEFRKERSDQKDLAADAGLAGDRDSEVHIRNVCPW